MTDLNDFLSYNDPWNNDPFYLFENDSERIAFKEWFLKEAKKYNYHTHYKYSQELLESIIPAGCYGNGQYLAIKDKNKYVEGLVSPNGTYVNDEYIPHGFNLAQKRVVDFTYKKIVNETPKYLSKLPTEYWGIEIPYDYILQESKKNEKISPYFLHKPLLLQYWRDQIKSNE